jgi:hypothetical protein
MMPIFPSINRVSENIIPAIQSVTQIDARWKINLIDCVVFGTEPPPAVDTIRDPAPLYRGSTVFKIRTASKDDTCCTSIRKKSGVIRKKQTGMRTILESMASQSICFRLDDSF